MIAPPRGHRFCHPHIVVKLVDLVLPRDPVLQLLVTLVPDRVLDQLYLAPDHG
jgi:hypothetical protein